MGGVFAAVLAPAAMAHPDYWVTVKYQFSFSETAIRELKLEWEFDVFFSSQAFDQYDLDRDGLFSQEEARALQLALFAPLADKDYFVRVYKGDAAHPMRLKAFTPRINDDRLTISFMLVPEQPLTYGEMPIAIVTHDKGAYDFTLSESDFLRIEGAYDPACRFRIEDGKGPLKGIPQTVVLICSQ